MHEEDNFIQEDDDILEDDDDGDPDDDIFEREYHMPDYEERQRHRPESSYRPRSAQLYASIPGSPTHPAPLSPTHASHSALLADPLPAGPAPERREYVPPPPRTSTTSLSSPTHRTSTTKPLAAQSSDLLGDLDMDGLDGMDDLDVDVGALDGLDDVDLGAGADSVDGLLGDDLGDLGDLDLGGDPAAFPDYQETTPPASEQPGGSETPPLPAAVSPVREDPPARAEAPHSLETPEPGPGPGPASIPKETTTLQPGPGPGPAPAPAPVETEEEAARRRRIEAVLAVRVSTPEFDTTTQHHPSTGATPGSAESHALELSSDDEHGGDSARDSSPLPPAASAEPPMAPEALPEALRFSAQRDLPFRDPRFSPEPEPSPPHAQAHTQAHAHQDTPPSPQPGPEAEPAPLPPSPARHTNTGTSSPPGTGSGALISEHSVHRYQGTPKVAHARTGAGVGRGDAGAGRGPKRKSYSPYDTVPSLGKLLAHSSTPRHLIPLPVARVKRPASAKKSTARKAHGGDEGAQSSAQRRPHSAMRPGQYRSPQLGQFATGLGGGGIGTTGMCPVRRPQSGGVGRNTRRPASAQRAAAVKKPARAASSKGRRKGGGVLREATLQEALQQRIGQHGILRKIQQNITKRLAKQDQTQTNMAIHRDRADRAMNQKTRRTLETIKAREAKRVQAGATPPKVPHAAKTHSANGNGNGKVPAYAFVTPEDGRPVQPSQSPLRTADSQEHSPPPPPHSPSPHRNEQPISDRTLHLPLEFPKHALSPPAPSYDRGYADPSQLQQGPQCVEDDDVPLYADPDEFDEADTRHEDVDDAILRSPGQRTRRTSSFPSMRPQSAAQRRRPMSPTRAAGPRTRTALQGRLRPQSAVPRLSSSRVHTIASIPAYTAPEPGYAAYGDTQEASAIGSLALLSRGRPATASVLGRAGVRGATTTVRPWSARPAARRGPTRKAMDAMMAGLQAQLADEVRDANIYCKANQISRTFEYLPVDKDEGRVLMRTETGDAREMNPARFRRAVVSLRRGAQLAAATGQNSAAYAAAHSNLGSSRPTSSRPLSAMADRLRAASPPPSTSHAALAAVPASVTRSEVQHILLDTTTLTTRLRDQLTVLKHVHRSLVSSHD